MVSGLFGASIDVLEDLQDFAATRAGGNPFFVEEIVRTLVGNGVLVREGDRWTCTAACASIDVPPTRAAALAHRSAARR
jgi:predicted ATPase